MKYELKPCPFCGVDDRQHIVNEGDSAYVRCQMCGATSGRSYSYDPVARGLGALATWNRRGEVRDHEHTS